jgi:hypothetical protein
MARHHRVECRLSANERLDLDALAMRRGLTRSGMMRALIEEAITRTLQRDELIATTFPHLKDARY